MLFQFPKNILLITIILIVSMQMLFAQNGIVKSYYPDGILRSEISYVNDILDGPAFWFYPNGNLETEKNYSKGKLSGYIREYYETGLMKEEYTVEDGIRDGSHRIFYDNSALKELIIFSEGKQVSKSTFQFDSTFITLPEAYQAGNRQQEILNKKKTELICDVDICPVPIGGMKSIQENIIYPEHALLYGLEGTVILIATVDENGKVVETQVIKNLGLGCDESAQEAVKKIVFIPGQKNGKAVQSRVTLNVEFKIFGNELVSADVSKKNDVTSEVKSEPGKKAEIPVTSNEMFIVKTVIKCELEECPQPASGIETIKTNLIIPLIAERLKLKGEIIVEAHIDRYGIVQDTKIIKGIGYGCDEALESTIMNTKFNPARINGQEADSKITIYFPFNYLK